MRTRYRRGTTAQNNALTLPEGRITIDTEKRAVRLHDGVTPGGFELVGTQAVETPTAGDLTAGFYEEVPGTEFITYGNLSSEVGLSQGSLVNDLESAWLKMSFNDQVFYIAKKNARSGVEWDTLSSLNLLSPGGTTVTINEKLYEVTLLTSIGTTSEWDQLMYPIHDSDINAQGWGVNYTNEDLELGVGIRSWNQEIDPNDSADAMSVGRTSITDKFHYPRSGYFNVYWRPTLRLVP